MGATRAQLLGRCILDGMRCFAPPAAAAGANGEEGVAVALTIEPARSFFRDSGSEATSEAASDFACAAASLCRHNRRLLRRVVSPAASPARLSLMLAARAVHGWLEHGGGNTDDARGHVAAALAADPSSTEAWTLAIWLEASLHQWEAAAALAHARATPRLRTPRRPPAPHHALTAPAPAVAEGGHRDQLHVLAYLGRVARSRDAPRRRRGEGNAAAARARLRRERPPRLCVDNLL